MLLVLALACVLQAGSAGGAASAVLERPAASAGTHADRARAIASAAIATAAIDHAAPPSCKVLRGSEVAADPADAADPVERAGAPGAAARGGAERLAISGIVVDREGAPVAGARVILGELGRATLYYNTPEGMFVGAPGLAEDEARACSATLAADAGGRFAAEGLVPGEYTLLAADPRRGVACATQVLAAGEPREARLVLDPPAHVAGSVAGLAFDPAVHVLALVPRSSGLNVTLVPRLEQEPGSWSFRSVALPRAAGWSVTGTHWLTEQDFRATLFSVPVDAAPGAQARVDLRLDSGARVAGRVLDDSGAPARNVSVVATSERRPATELGALTDAEGRFRLGGLAPGAWRLEALRYGVRELPGCGNGPRELQGSRALVVAGEETHEVELRVEASRAPPAIGELAPDFAAPTLDGGKVALSALRGKVVLIDFWATWCGMCRADFPRLIAAHRELGGGGRFEIVGVSIDEDQELVRRFAASRGLAWPQTALGTIAQNPIARLYNVNSTPSTVLVGPDGRVVALNLTGEELRQRLQELLR